MPVGQFFADTLEYQHVGVDRHTDRQDDAGDARQGQSGAERGHGTHDQHHVQAKRNHRDHAAQPVVDDHEERYADKRIDTDLDAVGDVGPSERGFGVEHGIDRDLERETAADERIGDGFGLFFREAAGDLGVAASDLLHDVGSAVKSAVKHDRQLTMDVTAGDLRKILTALGVESQRDLALAPLIFDGVRPSDVGAVHFHIQGNVVITQHGLFVFVRIQNREELVIFGSVVRQKFLLLSFAAVGVFLLEFRQILLDQPIVFLMDEAEFQSGAVLDDVEQFSLFVLGHHGSTQNDLILAEFGDLRLEDPFRFQALTEYFYRHLAVAVEAFRNFLPLLFIQILQLVELQIKLDAAVEVQSKTDRTGRLLAHQTQHVAVVLNVLALDHLGQVYAVALRGLLQRLRLVEIRLPFLQFFGFGDQFFGIGELRFVADHADEGLVIVSLRQRVHRPCKNRHHHRDDDGSEYQRTTLHDLTCPRSFLFRRR